MTAVDLSKPATLKWMSRDTRHERSFMTLREAVRFAMQDLRKAEFLMASLHAEERVYQGDEIVELFQRGGIAVKRFAPF